MINIFVTVSYVLFTGLMYWRLPDDTANIFDRNSVLFFMLIAQGLGIVMSSVNVFNQERSLLRRERSKKLYRVLPYFLAKVSSDMTNSVLLPMTYGIVIYFSSNLRLSFVAFLKFVLGFYLMMAASQNMGFLLSIMYPSYAMTIVIPISVFILIMGGFYVPFNNMNAVMYWASHFSFARYGYSALVVNEFEGREIPCAGLTGVSIGESNDCPMPGDAVFESIGLQGVFANYWFNIVILFIFQLAFLVVAYALLRRTK